MRSTWEALYRSLSQSIRQERAIQAFQSVNHDPELRRFRLPIDVVVYLHGLDPDLDAKDRVLMSLVGMVQRKEERDLAMALLTLGLWPGLDAAFKRKLRRERVEPGEVASVMFENFAHQVRRLDFDQVSRVAATLVRNTERDAGRDLRRLRSESSSNEDCAEATWWPQDSPFDVPSDVRPETELWLLHNRLSAVEGVDPEVLLAVKVMGYTQADAARALGISEEAGRKRMQRGLRRARAWLEANVGEHLRAEGGVLPTV